MDGGRKFKDWADEALTGFRYGVHDEDSTKIFGTYGWSAEPPMGKTGGGNFFEHFYNANTSDPGERDLSVYGLAYFRPSTRRAQDLLYDAGQLANYGCVPDILQKLSNLDRERLYTYLGKIIHLIQDPGVPEHVHNTFHATERNNRFEVYVRDNWDKIVSSEAFQKAVNPEPYGAGDYEIRGMNYPEYYIGALARISQRYPRESWKLSDAELQKMAEALISEAIKYTAGYMDAIYKELTGQNKIIQAEGTKRIMPASLEEDTHEMTRLIAKTAGAIGNDFCQVPPPQPIGPAGDHPDDRFDVSDEYYWEREFKLTENDLTRLYLRTAVKKGKIGIWYKDQFIKAFYEGRVKYKDASKEVQDAIEERFQGLKKKLEERKNLAQSDWKGAPDVALFTNGFYNPSISLMLKIGEPVRFIEFEFDPGIGKDHPVLLVPTGGFYGLKNTASLKTRLEEYVRNGGTLVAFTQQHGYNWDLLPAPLNPETGERIPVKG